MLNQLLKSLIGKTLDAHVAKCFDTDAVAEKPSRR